MDALRAMREARYAQDQARAAKNATTPASRAQPVKPRPAVAPPPEPGADDELCGHRNMGGRTCTREKGHAAKSHRYG